MSYTIIRQGDTDAPYLISCVVDQEQDIQDLPTTWVPGSMALVIENSNIYRLNSNGKWIKGRG